MAPILKSMWAAQIRLSRFYKNKREETNLKGVRGWRIWEELWGEGGKYYKKYYMQVSNLQKINKNTIIMFYKTQLRSELHIKINHPLRNLRGKGRILIVQCK